MSDHCLVLHAVGLSLLSPAQALPSGADLVASYQPVFAWVSLSLYVVSALPWFVPAIHHPTAAFPASVPSQSVVFKPLLSQGIHKW